MFKKDQLNQLALPLILSNVVSLVISLCDQAVMGHLSITSFAAVGIVAGFINSVTGVLGATSISFNILGARVYQNQSLFRKYLETQVILSLLILSIIPTAILSYLIFGSLMSISGGGNVQEIMEITFLNIPIFIIGIIYLFLFVPVITMTVRRWRDVGLRASGIILIFCLLVLIVILGFIIHLKQNIIIDFLIVISSSMFLITLMPSQICCTNSKNRISQFFFCSKGER